MNSLQGAEATVTVTEERVLKERERKKYRHQELDDKIRRERTESEHRIIREARKNGVNVPETSMKGDYRLEMEKIDGETLKECLEENTEALEELGRHTARLHETDIIHGDLTTRNAIVAGDVYLIDFGLAFRSQRTEDRAVDIHLLKQMLESSHPVDAEEAWRAFLKGYSSYEKCDEVMERLKEVEKRGRYK
ncbi:MAG: KEOPS complex kinase/ATPase Bud32 [Candidatus Nanohaloarchaea archaeon]